MVKNMYILLHSRHYKQNNTKTDQRYACCEKRIPNSWFICIAWARFEVQSSESKPKFRAETINLEKECNLNSLRHLIGGLAEEPN